MRMRPLLAWIAVGLLGLALAAGVSYAATQLSNQQIGLSAEPPSAGEELVPAATRTTPRRTQRPRPPARTTPAATAPPQTTAPPVATAPPPAATAPPTATGGGGDDGGSRSGSGGGERRGGERDD